MNAEVQPLCWICGGQADSGEHRFKASDIRRILTLSPQSPGYLHSNVGEINRKIGSAKSRTLQFSRSVCARCNDTKTQCYDRAWDVLSGHIRDRWREIRERRSVDLVAAFGSDVAAAALDVHLYFLKAFGCKLIQDKEPFDVAPFAACLLERHAHPEVRLYIADATYLPKRVLAFESDVYKMWNRPLARLDGVMWGYVVRPVAIKVAYIREGTPLCVRGHAWRPGDPRRFVRLSPYRGAVEPIPGLTIDFDTSQFGP